MNWVPAALHLPGPARHRPRRGRPRRRPQPDPRRAQPRPRLRHPRGLDRRQLRPLPLRRQALGLQNLVSAEGVIQRRFELF